jgi:hypothetical protein
MVNPFVMSFKFQAETAGFKPALAEARKDVTSVGEAADVTAASLNAAKEALEREAAASREAAAAARDHAAAEKSAHEAVNRALGVRATPAPIQRPAISQATSGGDASSTAFVSAGREQTAMLRGLGAEVEATRQEAVLYRSELDAVRARYNPLFAASKQYEQELRDIAEAEQFGALSAREAAAAREVAASRMMPMTAGMRQLGGDTKLTSWEMRNLTYQMNDVFQTILLGMPIQQVLLQQGPQITQIYGGVGNTFKAVARALTPLRLGLGLTAGAAILAGAAFNSHLRSTKDLEAASTGLGRAVAGSASEMEASARAGAAAAGISVSAARAMQTQFLRTGKIGSENFEDLVGLSKDFATTMGIDADKAGEALAEMFADPSKAADELYNKYGLIDGATARYASNLAAQNRLEEARAVLLEALPDRLASATDATTLLGKAWQGVATGAKNAYGWIGSSIDRALSGPSLDEQLAEARARLAQAERFADSPRKRARGGIADPAEARAEVVALEAQLAAEQAVRDRAAAVAKGAVADGIAKGSDANANAQREQELRNQLVALRDGQNAPGLDATSRNQIADAIEATSNALVGLISRRQQEVELDRIEIQLRNEQNPLIRAELEARKTLLQLGDQEVTSAERAREAARARNRVMEETIRSAQAQAAQLDAENALRAQLNAQAANGKITQADVNRLLQEELQLRPLIAAAAKAEGDEKARLLEVVEALRIANAAAATLQLQADQTKSVQDYLRGQDEKLQMLRIEAALLGQSEIVRQRQLALAVAEQQIADRRLDTNSSLAAQIRDQAAAHADETRELQKQIDTWKDLKSTAEGTVDGVVDSLLNADFGGALEQISKDITGTLAELAIANPLKNVLLGSDYGTLDDVGGIGGIIARLTGKETASASAGAKAFSASAMTVTAGSVTINGGLTPGLLGLPANTNAALSGDASKVGDQIAAFFSGKGLKPHQIAGIMGNVGAESGFDPRATGDGGTSFGLFQHHAERGAGLLGAVGGIGGLGDVQAQLEYTWKELLTGENGVLKKLLASTNVQGATVAFAGFERPAGWSATNPEGSSGWARRLSGAESALAKFGQTAATSTEDLGTLGKGFDLFGAALGNGLQGLASGGASGGLSGLLGTLGSAFATSLGLPGFRVGGETGGSDPSRVAGVVHEAEYVFDAASTARIGPKNLEALRRGSLRGFATGGYVSSIGSTYSTASAGPANSAAAPVINMPITIVDKVGVQVEPHQTTDSKGQRQLTMIIGEQMAAAQAQRGNPSRKGLQSEFGLRPVARDRG